MPLPPAALAVACPAQTTRPVGRRAPCPARRNLAVGQSATSRGTHAPVCIVEGDPRAPTAGSADLSPLPPAALGPAPARHLGEIHLGSAGPTVPPTNNGTERAIGKWRIRSRSTWEFKSWAGLEAVFLPCGSVNI